MNLTEGGSRGREDLTEIGPSAPALHPVGSRRIIQKRVRRKALYVEGTPHEENSKLKEFNWHFSGSMHRPLDLNALAGRRAE